MPAIHARLRRSFAVKISLACLIFIVVTVAKTYPLIVHSGTHLPGDLGDPLLVTWILAWDFHALTTNPLSLFHANIFYPAQFTLALSEHMIAAVLLFAPAYVLTDNPVFAYNTVFFLSFVLSGVSMFLLVYYWTESFWASLLAGILFAFTPIRLAQFVHLQLYNFYWVPLSLIFLDKFLRKQKIIDLCYFSVLLWLQVLSSVYLGVFATIMVGVYIYFFVLYIDRNLFSLTIISKFIVFILLTFVVLISFHLPYYHVMRQWEFTQPLQESIHYSADPILSYLNPASLMNDAYRRILQFAVTHFPGYEKMLFPGLVCGVLVVVGSIGFRHLGDSVELGQAKRLFSLLLLVSFLLSLGPFLILFGVNTGIPLPYLILFYLVPGFQAMRVPARFALSGALAASVLAAIGLLTIVSWLGERWPCKRIATSVLRGCVAIICLGLFLLELGFTPLPLVGVPTGEQVPAVYRWLATGPIDGPIIELPLGRESWQALQYMYGSTYHWLPLVNGASRFTPPTHQQLFAELSILPARAPIELLSALGVKGIILHSDQLDSTDALRWQQVDLPALGLQEMARFGPDIVYALTPVETAPTLSVDLALPNYLPPEKLLQFPAGGRMRVGFVARNVDHRRWVHPGPLGKVWMTMRWEALAGGHTYEQQEHLALPLTLADGEMWSSGLSLRTPLVPGRYLFSSALPTLSLASPQRHVEVVTGAYATSVSAAEHLSAEYFLEEPKAETLTGSVVDLTVQVVNTGKSTWLAETKDERGEVRLGWRWYREQEPLPLLEGREHLAYDVFPGLAYRFRATMHAPPTAGVYTLEVGLVCELVTWFADRGVPPMKFIVDVEAPASPPPLASE